jgi:hypothetical protein
MFEGGPRRWGVSQMDALGAQAQAKWERTQSDRVSRALVLWRKYAEPGQVGGDHHNNFTVSRPRVRRRRAAGRRWCKVVLKRVRARATTRGRGRGRGTGTGRRDAQDARCTRMPTLDSARAHLELHCTASPARPTKCRTPIAGLLLGCRDCSTAATAALHGPRHQSSSTVLPVATTSLKPTLHSIEASWPCFDMRVPSSCG